MPRRAAAAKRKVMPDPLYSNELLSKFINCVMEDGKKSVAEKIVYQALDLTQNKLKGRVKDILNVSDKSEEDGDAGRGGSGSVTLGDDRQITIKLFEKTIDKIRPILEVRSRRVGGATYQVPVEVRPTRQTALAIRWLIQAARARGEKSMAARLAGEMADALEGKGSAIAKRENTHKMAKANQAFAHFRW